MTAPAARLLFIIDNDFGALGTVLYLLHRQPLAANSTLLLPRRMHELHGAGLPVASRPYDSLQDILDVVERDSPGVAFLFSGYLLAAQRCLTIGELGKLVRALRQRGCRVATSDPYLGTFRQVAAAGVPPRATGGFVARWLAHLLHGKRLARHVRKVADILEGVTHVYPIPVDSLEGGSGARRVAVFNPGYMRSVVELREISAAVAALPGETAGAKRWLFVLAQFDLEFQERRHGKERFAELVAGKIREALDCGRHASFIGPASVTQALAPRFAGDSRVRLLSYCAFGEFERRLLDAEIVFHWHISSTSAFLRLWNGLPIFFFDQGHVPRVFKPLHDAGLKHYYMGEQPVVLDIEKPLDVRSLGELGLRFPASARATCERLSSLPSLEEMVLAV